MYWARTQQQAQQFVLKFCFKVSREGSLLLLRLDFELFFDFLDLRQSVTQQEESLTVRHGLDGESSRWT